MGTLASLLALSLGAALLTLLPPAAASSIAVPPPPAPCPEQWRGLLGAYGGKDGPLVREEDGRLEALFEGTSPRTLEPLGHDTFRFVRAGPSAGSALAVFMRSGSGQATAVTVDGAVLARRDPEVEGAVFRITPRRPVAELRREALAASPPREDGPFRPPELVDLLSLEPGLRLDVRYASKDNFLGVAVYPSARAFLQREAAMALVRAHRALRRHGYGLLIHDAYRPWWVTKVFWEATPPDRREFVADPAKGSRHNRGCAVDLTLCRLDDGQAVEMPGVYDEMSERSYPGYPGGTSRERWHRELLRAAMEEQGFTVFESEWWHFDYRVWREYPILNLPFDAIASPAAGPVASPGSLSGRAW